MPFPIPPATGRGARAAAALLALGAAALLLACDRGPSRARPAAERLTVAVSPWLPSAAIYIAQEKGYFRDEGLDTVLRECASGHLGLADVIAGNADITAATETPIARAAIDGKPVAVVATIGRIEDAMLIIARKGRGIAKIEDLAGRTVGRVAGSAAAFFLHLCLTTSYVDPRDVRTVDLQPEQVVPALLDGRVDAVSTWAPQTTILQARLGDNAVVLDLPGLYTMTWNLVARRDRARDAPGTLARFLRAIDRANRLIARSPGEARAIAAKAIGVDPRSTEAEWVNLRLTAQLDQSLVIALEDQARWMVGAARPGARPIPDLLQVIDSRPLAAVRPDAVRIASD